MLVAERVIRGGITPARAPRLRRLSPTIAITEVVASPTADS